MLAGRQPRSQGLPLALWGVKIRDPGNEVGWAGGRCVEKL